MKFLIAFAAVVAVAVAGTTSDPANVATVLKSIHEAHNDGSYVNTVETSDGFYQTQTGSLKSVPGAETPVNVFSGEYWYTGPDNVKYHVTYVADENGYQPTGAHLPVAPVA